MWSARSASDCATDACTAAGRLKKAPPLDRPPQAALAPALTAADRATGGAAGEAAGGPAGGASAKNGPAPLRLIRFFKPYGVLSQFTPEGRWRGLRDFIALPGFHAAGRLDGDSEGLLLLTNDGRLQARIADPRFKMAKTYWAQVEGVPDAAALAALRRGITLNDGPTRPATVRLLPDVPALPPRSPPIRVRLHQPTSWIELVITEGRNRQVRRMTAAVGHPTLRLVRIGIGPHHLGGLQPGEWAPAVESDAVACY